MQILSDTYLKPLLVQFSLGMSMVTDLWVGEYVSTRKKEIEMEKKEREREEKKLEKKKRKEKEKEKEKERKKNMRKKKEKRKRRKERKRKEIFQKKQDVKRKYQLFKTIQPLSSSLHKLDLLTHSFIVPSASSTKLHLQEFSTSHTSDLFPLPPQNKLKTTFPDIIHSISHSFSRKYRSLLVIAEGWDPRRGKLHTISRSNVRLSVYCHFLFHFVVNHGTSSPILGASANAALVLTRFLVASLLIGGLSCTTTIRSDAHIVLVCDNKDQTSLEVKKSSINVNFVSCDVRSRSHVAFVAT